MTLDEVLASIAHVAAACGISSAADPRSSAPPLAHNASRQGAAVYKPACRNVLDLPRSTSPRTITHIARALQCATDAPKLRGTNAIDLTDRLTERVTSNQVRLTVAPCMSQRPLGGSAKQLCASRTSVAVRRIFIKPQKRFRGKDFVKR